MTRQGVHGLGLIVMVSQYQRLEEASILLTIVHTPVKCGETRPLPSHNYKRQRRSRGLFADNKMSPVGAADMFSCRAMGQECH